MREILFRGGRIDNGELVEGAFLNDRDGAFYICPAVSDISYGDSGNRRRIGCWYKVDPPTVCQYTGMTDKNGKRIFEGDIIDCWSEGVNAKGTVQQRIDGLWIIHPAWQNHIVWGICPDKFGNTTVEIIGNIHDNPELLKEGANNG